MPTGLKETFRFLTDTENESAVEVLIAGLECPHRGIRERALRALLARRSARGHTAVFRRLPKLDARCHAIVGERPGRLLAAAKEALGSRDADVIAAAHDAILTFRLYDAMPVLTAMLSDKRNPDPGRTAETILALADRFYQELSAPDRPSQRHDIDSLRRRLTGTLEEAVGRFRSQPKSEVVEAFLMLARQQNVYLRRILQEPGDRTREIVLEILRTSSRGAVLRLLLGFLEDAQLPNAVRSVLSSRDDAKFVENLLRCTAPRPSRQVAKTLARFETFAWARPDHDLLVTLDGEVQESAVHFLMASGMPHAAVFGVLKHLLAEGKPGGRRAAAERLAEFEGAEADALVVEKLEDEDPGVRAHLIGQVRQRQIPGAMSLLIRFVDSPHHEVRQALRDALPEFSYRRFMANLDSIDADLLPTAGHVVGKVDGDVRIRVATDLEGPSPVKRRRAVVAASAMGLVRDMEERIINRLSDDDHMVRLAAAQALAQCETVPSWDALRDALLDRSVVVQEAAEQSLTRIAQSLQTDVEEESEEVMS
jgi:HEAT repeat protein